MAGDRTLKICLIAGEPSGDILGADLMTALAARSLNRVEFLGVGGPEMQAAGLRSLFPMADLSVMGLAEILPRLPRLIRRFRQTVAAIEAARPDAVITIDSPGFNVRLLRRLREQRFPKIHYVAPSVWAWRPGRAGRLAALADHLLALLPFEPPYFEAVGLPCTFVGHPAVTNPPQARPDRFRTRHGIPADAPLLAVLAGSRAGEVDRLAPLFGDALRTIARQVEGLHCVTVVPDGVRAVAEAHIRDWPAPVTVIAEPTARWDAFAASDAALAASGTVTLEIAAMGTPMVVAYRMAPLTMAVARRLIKVRYASLINIVLDREAIPEFLQAAATPSALAGAVARLLIDPQARAGQIADLEAALAVLRSDGTAPGERAADVVLTLVGDDRDSPRTKETN